MNYLTAFGAIDTDPYFDKRSLRPGYNDWHKIVVPLEEREPIPGVALMVSYLAHVSYTDAGDMKIDQVELLTTRTTEENRCGRPLKPHPPSLLTPAEVGIVNLLMADAESQSGRDEINSAIVDDQKRRDEEDIDF